jgi:methyl-accepting chemotaxis protein
LELNRFAKIRSAKAYLVIAFICLLGILAVHKKSELDFASAKDRFRLESHAATLAAANLAQNQFDDIYQNIRTISRLPSVRKVDREGTTLTPDSIDTIQEIYNNLASNVDVSEVYVVPRTLNADLIDPATSSPEKPIISLDDLIANDAGGGGVTKRFEAEIYEYHLLRRQMAWFDAHTPTTSATDGINVPMISGGQVVTCDNTVYNSTLNDSDRTGTIFSVPFFGPDNRFKGTVSAIIRLKAVRAVLPNRGFALVSPTYNEFLLSPHAVLDALGRGYARRAEPDPRLIYSEVLPLSIHDPRASWSLWADVPNSAFFKRPDVQAARTFEIGAYAVVILLTLVAMLVIWLVDRNARLVGRATTALTRLAEGDESYSLPGAGLSGPAAGLARAFAKFRDALLEKRRNEARAEADRQVADAERIRSDQERAKALAAAALVVGSISEGLKSLSGGDLMFRLRTELPEGYENLRTDFNAAMEQVADLVRKIVTITESINSGSNEIARGADDLSKRTVQQAGSLEQSAGSLEKLTTTVRRTAESAMKVSLVIARTKADAQQSGEIVRKATGAMANIERSSNEISQIIGVIDEIAFQTNLLALNAGVEAARAGDSGRGFAVVASEVRALAQRSADAAKQIKTLIATSTGEVGAGVGLVNEAGKSLDRIISQVSEITGSVAEMAKSAQEQATGLHDVNAAVNHMDRVTQQNAAMVEESTAASHALDQETAELLQLTNRFQVAAVDVAPIGLGRSSPRGAMLKAPVLHRAGR